MAEGTDLRNQFHSEIADLRSNIARLGSSVVELIPRVTDILLQQDLEGAQYVLRGDAAIDKRALGVEEASLRIMALQAPVARDLREVASAFKLASEIERSADLCSNLCKAARRIYGIELDPKLRGLIQRMSDQALSQYRQAVEAYISHNAAMAAALPDMDDYLDDLHRQFISQIFESHNSSNVELQTAVQLAVVARFYERLGDHAVTISHRVSYIENGWPEDDVVEPRAESIGVLEGPTN